MKGFTGIGYGQGPLSATYSPEAIAASLRAWSPFPPIDQRDPWLAVPATARDEALARAHAAASAPWPDLPSNLRLGFTRTGDREGYETPYFERRRLLSDLVCGAGLTGEIDDVLLDRLWDLCEESSWCIPAHDPRAWPDPRTPELDLFGAQTGAQVAIALHVLRPALDDVSPDIAMRLAVEVEHRVITPYLTHDDWWWLGIVRTDVNNWNPWINLNALIAGLLTLEDPARRTAVIRRTAQSVDAYLTRMPEDGGCTEGQNYWPVAVAKVGDVIGILQQATGIRMDLEQMPALSASARYPVAMHIDSDRMVQHADGPALMTQDPHVLYRYAQLVDDAQLRRLAVSLRWVDPSDSPAVGNLWDRFSRLLDQQWHGAEKTPAPFPGVSWFPITQVLTARENPGSADGLFLAVKGGHNDEDHNHNDVGSFSVALHGRPLIVDPGVGTYSAQTFGAGRYDLWTMQSGWHALPIINGVDQAPGAQHQARQVSVDGVQGSAGEVEFAAELADAWPQDAGVRSWRRRVSLDRVEHTIQVEDAWELTRADSLELALVCALQPHPEGELTRLGDLRIEHPGLTATVEERPIPAGDRLEAAWGRMLWRVLLRPDEIPEYGSWTVRFGYR